MCDVSTTVGRVSATRRGLALTAMMLLAGTVASCAQTTLPVGVASLPADVCVIRDARIVEASGLVASRRNPGCYYVHNDSGDSPRVFLINRTGQTLLTIQLDGARAIDYEDIALAPGRQPGSYDVCVADIGDNRATRADLTIYRFPEPDARAFKPGTTTGVSVTAYRVRYADGPADAEAFFVRPQTGDGYVLTKRTDGKTHVYKLAAPWDADGQTELRRVRTVTLPPAILLARVVTAADISPDGTRVAVRCYFGGWQWRLPADAAAFESVFDRPPTPLVLAPEQQGEALCYAADGQSLVTISEGSSPTLHEVAAATPK